MDENDQVEEQGSETEEQSVSGATDVAKLQAKIDKLEKENYEHRTYRRRAEIASEFGTDVAELIPDTLPAEDWKPFAEKLAGLKGQPVAETTAKDEAVENARQFQENLNEREARLATVGASQATGASPAGSGLTGKEIRELGKRDPAAALQAIKTNSTYRS